jgi:hypothetical protein
MILFLSLFACSPEVGPLGLPLDDDGVVRAGAAVVDITPEITETYTDVNGDHEFSGCLDDPSGERCGEPFDDVNGNGWFDAVFIGGFGPMRPARAVHDPISVRAAVIVKDGEYLAFVGMDFVGLGQPRIHAAADALAEDGFDPTHLLAGSSHNHQGPDTMGLWGNPYDLAAPVSGADPDYQTRISEAIERAVREAAAAVEPVDLRVGAQAMRDRGPWFNGPRFGGKNPDERFHGMIHDGRDPVVVSDQVLAIQGLKPGTSEAVFTLTNWSGHPETWGGDNDQISADWIAQTRVALEAQYGGVALHIPGCLGGMMSALHGDVPLVLDDGTHVFQKDDAGQPLVDADGDTVPEWAPKYSWDFARSHGWHIAEAAMDALETGDPLDPNPMTVQVADVYVPVRNLAYQLLGPKGMFDRDFSSLMTDPARCPAVADGSGVPGCLPTRTMRVRVGEVGLITVPGELLPELAWGMPADPVFASESTDVTARGPESVYFPQHDADCNTVDYEECRGKDSIGDCDCLAVHAAPYRLSDDPAQRPLLDVFSTKYRAVLGATDDYISYIIPEPDFNKSVSLLSAKDGDHYEDTVSPAFDFATILQNGQATLGQ